MSERTLWKGIQAEARLKMQEYGIRISGIRSQLRALLVESAPERLNDELIHSLAVDLRSAMIEYRSADATYKESCRELGEPC